MIKEIYYDKEIFQKSLKRVSIMFAGGFIICIVFYLTKFMGIEVIISITGIQMLIFSYFYLLTKKMINYDKPVLVLYHDYMELSDFNYFFILKTKSVIYNEIKSMGMDTKKDRYGSRTYLNISLKNGKDIEFEIQHLGLDSTSLTKLINEVNPDVKIINYGSFEYC